MKRITIALLTASICLLTSCGTGRHLTRNTMEIQEGMTKAQVLEIMGEAPKFRNLHKGVEEWEYIKFNELLGVQYISIMITFHEEKVVGMSSLPYSVRYPSPTPAPPPSTTSTSK